MASHRVCPVELAGSLDSRFRRWVHDPHRILKGLVKEGMTVLDVGCGPGVFSLAMAEMVGKSGRVIAADLQQGMLERLKAKLDKDAKRTVRLHKCEEDRLGVKERIDFALVFYVLHEMRWKAKVFKELHALLKPHGKVLLVEPPFHVSKREFERMLELAKHAGFSCGKGPKVFMGRSAVLTRKD